MKLQSKTLFLLALITLSLSKEMAFSYSDEILDAKLSIHMSTIREEAREHRYWGGGTLLALGTGFGIGAALSSRPTTTTALGIGGGLFSLLGIGILLFPTEFERVPVQYFELPKATPEQLQKKVIFGESALRRFANDAKRSRIYGGAMMIAFGVAYVGWYAADSSEAFRLYTGLMFTGLGVANFFIERRAESEFRDYHEWKAMEKKVTHFRWGIMPLKGGSAFMLAMSF